MNRVKINKKAIITPTKNINTLMKSASKMCLLIFTSSHEMRVPSDVSRFQAT